MKGKPKSADTKGRTSIRPLTREIVPQPTQPPTKRFSFSRTELHIGPLPHPNTLAAYDQIVPGSASMLMEEFREQGAHRRRLEEKVVEGDQRRANYGLVLGYIGILFLLLGGIASIVIGYGPYGIVLIATAIATVLGSQAKATHDRKKDLINKSKLVPSPEPESSDPANMTDGIIDAP